jgi:dTDP-4-dehydrorhamnose reductase
MTGRILIVGGDSEIAAATVLHLRAHGRGVVTTTRRPERVTADRPFLDLSQPVDDWPIPDGVGAACLCAAVARLNDCAEDPVGSARINVAGNVSLARKLLARGIPVLFLSTDKVFDGERSHVPADAPPCPVSEYGRQKAAAEAALGELMSDGAPAAILRLAKVVMPSMELLRQWVIELDGGRPIRAFHDMMMAPTPVALVAAAIERLLGAPTSGIFQLTGPRDVDYAAVARHLAQRIGADTELVETVSAYSVGLPVGSTARNTTLDSSALTERFGIVVPDAWTVINELIETCR